MSCREISPLHIRTQSHAKASERTLGDMRSNVGSRRRVVYLLPSCESSYLISCCLVSFAFFCLVSHSLSCCPCYLFFSRSPILVHFSLFLSLIFIFLIFCLSVSLLICVSVSLSLVCGSSCRVAFCRLQYSDYGVSLLRYVSNVPLPLLSYRLPRWMCDDLSVTLFSRADYGKRARKQREKKREKSEEKETERERNRQSEARESHLPQQR